MSTMGEGAEKSGSGGVPSDGPIPVGLDNFGRFSATNGEVEVSKRGGDFVFNNGGEESGEDGVKIDRRSGKDMLPL